MINLTASLRSAAARPGATTFIIRPSTTSTISRSAAAFHTFPPRSALKESDNTSKDRDSLPEEYEAHKEEQLDLARKTGKGKWKHELASNSEAAVKADRDETADTDEHIRELQKKTEEEYKKK